MAVNIIPKILLKVYTSTSFSSPVSLIKSNLKTGSFIVKYTPDSNNKCVRVAFKGAQSIGFQSSSGRYTGTFTTGGSGEIGGSTSHSILIYFSTNPGYTPAATILIPFYGSELYPSIIKANTTYSISFDLIKSYDYLIVSHFCVVEGSTPYTYYGCLDGNKMAIPSDFDALATTNNIKVLIKPFLNSADVSWKRACYHGDIIAEATRRRTILDYNRYTNKQGIRVSSLLEGYPEDDDWDSDYDWKIVNGLIYVNGISGNFDENKTILYTSTDNASIPPYVSPSGTTVTDHYSSVNNIHVMYFNGCSQLTSLPNSFMRGEDSSHNETRCAYLLEILHMPSTITDIGTSAFEFCKNLWDINISRSVTSIGAYAFDGCTCLSVVDLPHNLTIIESRTFNNCLSLVSISIPESVTRINWGAFANCSTLESINIPYSVTEIQESAFSGCANLLSINLREGLLSIGNYAFEYCGGLTSIEIPNSVTSIGNMAFYECELLKLVSIGEGITSFGNLAFKGCNNITTVIWNARYGPSYNFGTQVTSFSFGDNVKVIPESLCENMNKLTSITLPEGLIQIKYYAFKNCTGIVSMNLPSSITQIGLATFENCCNWTCLSLTIPNGITSIESNTFKQCKKLKEVRLPSSLTIIGNSAFRECTDLVAIKTGTHSRLPNLSSLGEYAFADCTSLISTINIAFYRKNNTNYIPEGVCMNCTNIHSVEIPSASYVLIGDNAFKNCTSLLQVSIDCNYILKQDRDYNDSLKSIFGTQVERYVIGSSVTKIGKNAFAGCTGLVSVNIPDNVTTIGEQAFINSGIQTVVIGAGVGFIPRYCFKNCSRLYSVDMSNSNLTCFAQESFCYCTSLTAVTFPDSIGTYVRPSDVPEEYTDPNGVFNDAFYGCSSLQTVTMNSSLNMLDTGVFNKCSSLNNLIFKGDSSQWNKVLKKYSLWVSWNTGFPAEVVHCSDKDVAIR